MSFSWLEICRKMGREVSRRVMQLYEKSEGRRRIGRGAGGDTTLLMDHAAEKIVFTNLRKMNACIISEEKGEVVLENPDIYIVVDPLDGSTNAERQIPFFAFSVAVLESRNLGSTNFAYVRDIFRGEEFWASKGKGAYMDGKRVRCSRIPMLKNICVSFPKATRKNDIPYFCRLMERAEYIRDLGSCALHMCYMARGSFECYFGGSIRLLDICSGKLIVEEAGGFVRDMFGNEIDHLEVGMGKSTSLLACSNRRVLKNAIEVLR